VVYYVQHPEPDSWFSLGRIAWLAKTIETNPAESSNWRKHKNACPFYRERWFPGNDIMAGEPMYQVFCMKDTPPLTTDEGDRCLHSKSCCWRLSEQKPAQEQTSTKQRRSTKDAPLHTS
jgi:hypothetical protein